MTNKEHDEVWTAAVNNTVKCVLEIIDRECRDNNGKTVTTLINASNLRKAVKGLELKRATKHSKGRSDESKN